MFLSILLILIGVIFLLKNLGVIGVETWGILWPVLLIVTGVCLWVKRRRWHTFWESL